MIQQPPDLVIEHPDILRARRNFQPEQLLGGQTEPVFLIDRRDIIEPIEIGNGLQIGLMLDQLLGATMQKADMPIDALDDLAVEFQDQSQHAMRRRMLRPEIDAEGAIILSLKHDRTVSSEWRMANRRPSIQSRRLV